MNKLQKEKDELAQMQRNDGAGAAKDIAERRRKKIQDLEEKIGELKKAFEAANRDKESMVIKYAMGEKDIIIAKRGKEELEKRLKD